jgi:uncharacterized protein with NRDE domain
LWPRWASFALQSSELRLGVHECMHVNVGVLVSQFLKESLNPLEYARVIEAKKNEYNGFNLVLCDFGSEPSSCAYVSNMEHTILEDFAPGVYCLSNTTLRDDRPWPKVVVARRSLFFDLDPLPLP